ncbi:hypothetical protein PQO03_09465 [Lentisphaera profundi]|uniref:ABC-2 type transporter domain-containing protein n=1 Tax=Lentisphaera profundi TaxID=1658616 RepID=A0ABY7VPM3_9BACT|nr:hypothetical protein [Lentisphaera profundi]WDE95942.1 hypothetical protein PQO03_09465 [Lentisphaera profundi]
MLNLKQIKAVTFNSAKNAASDPFYLVLQIGSLLTMLVLACLPSLSEASHVRFVRDQCLSFVFIAGCLGVVFSTIKTVTDDIQRGAGDIMMSRPISPRTFLLGKLCGLFFSQSLFFISLTSAYIWVSEIVHYPADLLYSSMALYIIAVIAGPAIGAFRQAFFNKSFPFFTSLAIPAVMLFGLIIRIVFGYRGDMDFLGLQALLLLFFASLAFAGILLPSAVRFDTPVVLLSGVLIFFLGLFSAYAIESIIPYEKLKTLSLGTVPNWQNYWILDHLALKGKVTGTYIFSCLSQSLLLCGLYLCLAISIFEKREINGST